MYFFILILAGALGCAGGDTRNPDDAHWRVQTATGAAPARMLQLNQAQAYRIGMQIWQNESQGSVIGLTHWNAGEEFASLGIGHFIWYPVGPGGPYRESFPEFLRYAKRNRVPVPHWLAFENPDCPWHTRTEFERDLYSPRMNELRDFLRSTVDVQTRFALARLEYALPEMLRSLPGDRRVHVEQQFGRLISNSQGSYALIDYVNFKGEGTSRHEQYGGAGWGLLQVLENMRGTGVGPMAVEEFVHSARLVLRRRVDFAPPERYESRYLRGWYKRLDTYLYFAP